MLVRMLLQSNYEKVRHIAMNVPDTLLFITKYRPEQPNWEF